jgi:MFS family permease
MFVWGAMSIGAKGIHSTAGLVAFRFFLGFVEAGFFPGVMLLLSCWYKPNELSKRLAIFYSASLMSGAFGGLLAGVITEYMNGVGNTPGWQWLFIIEGLATCCISVVAVFVLPDYPTTTKFLNEREKMLAVARLVSDEDDKERLTHKQAFFAAVKDVKTWLFTLGYVLLNGAGTISYFFPTLMTSLGYKGRDAQFMTVPIYCVALVVSVGMGWSADRTHQKAWHIVAATALSAVSFIICATVKKAVVRYAFICFGGAGIWTAVPLFLSYMVTQFEGREKRAVSIAIINGFGNLASVYGSFLWPSTDAPLYHAGFGATTGLIAAGGFVVTFIRLRYGDAPRVEGS